MKLGRAGADEWRGTPGGVGASDRGGVFYFHKPQTGSFGMMVIIGNYKKTIKNRTILKTSNYFRFSLVSN